MKKQLLLNSFLICGCSFLSLLASAQNVNYQELREAAFPGQTPTAEMEEVLRHVMVAPQPNRAIDAQKARQTRIAATKASEGMNGNYRPAEIITRNEAGELFMKYTYVYDEAGTFYTPGQSMVRDYKLWNKTDGVWDNNLRLKLIIDDNGDMVEAYTDQGYKDQWDNLYRIQMTYDDNHNQLSSEQAAWENDQWYAKLRWFNEYDTNGNILTQTYENRPTDSEWIKGSQHSWTYDDAGRELSHQIAHYSSASQQYSAYMKNEYTYDEKGNQTSNMQEQYGTPVFYQTMKYDDKNNKLSVLEKRWSNNEWVNYSYIVYTYDDQNRETSAITQLWSGDMKTGSWVNNRKLTSIYLATASNQTYYKYDTESESWKESERIINTYNEKGQQVRWSHDYWSDTKKQFQTESQDRYTYNSDYNLTEKISETWSFNQNEFIPTSIFNYEYDENLNGNKVMCSRKQTKEWVNLFYHNMQDTWDSPDYDSFIADATYIDLREYVKTTGVTLNHSDYELETELNVRLKATVLPADASNKEVHWTSSNEEVARVSVDGRVYGVAPGTATITARTLNGSYTASCQVTVTDELTAITNQESPKAFTYQEELIQFHDDQISTVQVIDINGRVIFRQDNRQSIRTSAWDKGLYFIRLFKASGNQTYKLQVH